MFWHRLGWGVKVPLCGVAAAVPSTLALLAFAPSIAAGGAPLRLESDAVPAQHASPQIPEGLAAALREGRVVVSVGAGFSMAAGLPGWEQLLQGIQTQCNTSVPMPADFHMTPYNELDQLQSEIIVKAGRECTCSAMRQQLTYRRETPEMTRRLDALFRLPVAGVVTWNWDTVLDSRCRVLPISRDFSDYGGNMLTSSLQEQPPLLKLQGSVSQADSLVLDEADYDRIRPFRSAFLRQLYFESDRVVLHLGQGLGGLTGGEVGPIFEDALASTNGTLPVRHYAITCAEDTPASKVLAVRRLGIQAVFYSDREGHDKGIRDVLHALASSL